MVADVAGDVDVIVIFKNNCFGPWQILVPCMKTVGTHQGTHPSDHQPFPVLLPGEAAATHLPF